MRLSQKLLVWIAVIALHKVSMEPNIIFKIRTLDISQMFFVFVDNYNETSSQVSVQSQI